jgi:cytochrome d ubiquinol oxidase subunit II
MHTDPSFLQGLWFILIGVLWAGYFVLEGFDFGVGMRSCVRSGATTPRSG